MDLLKMTFSSHLVEVKPLINQRDLEKSVHVFISSWLDLCNALKISGNQNSLQLVQNARMLTVPEDGNM